MSCQTHTIVKNTTNQLDWKCTVCGDKFNEVLTFKIQNNNFPIVKFSQTEEKPLELEIKCPICWKLNKVSEKQIEDIEKDEKTDILCCRNVKVTEVVKRWREAKRETK